MYFIFPRIRRTLLAALPLMLAMPATSLAGPSAEGSEWHIRITMEMPGMAPMPGGSFRHCYNENMVPYQESPGEECETISQSRSGDTVTWHMRCSGPEGESEIKGSSTYSGDAMNGAMHIASPSGEMDMKMEGSRIGPCN